MVFVHSRVGSRGLEKIDRRSRVTTEKLRYRTKPGGLFSEC